MRTRSLTAGRSFRGLVIGAAVTILLTLTGASVALARAEAPDKAAAGVLARTDVYLRDVAGDVGTEPHNLNPLWQSPDIKVCPTAVECATSQNPIVGVTNYIFVKLRNPGPYGSGVGTGTINLYRTTPGGGGAWPANWTFIGAAGVAVAPGVTTVTIPWNGVPGPGHFCLMARWVSSTDPMTFEGSDISVNTRYNNNIAWRNVDSVVIVPGGTPPRRPFAIGNAANVTTLNNLVLTQPGTPLQAVGGQVVVDLGQDLFARWRSTGMKGTGIRQVGETQVAIVEAKASIDGLPLKAGERVEFALTFSARALSKEQFLLDVTQFGPDANGREGADLGGVRYEITTAEK